MAENRFDASQEASMRFAWGPLARKCRAPRLSIETFADGNGNLAGAINIYLGDAVGGIPWRVLEMGNARLSGIPGSGSVDYITIVPQAGAQGIVAVSAGDAEEMTLTLGFPNGGGGGGALITPAADFAYTPNFTPVVNTRYTYTSSVTFTTAPTNGYSQGGRLCNSTDTVDFGADGYLNPGGGGLSGRIIANGAVQVGLTIPGTNNSNGPWDVLHTSEFMLKTGNLLDIRSWIDGYPIGWVSSLSVSGYIGTALAPSISPGGVNVINFQRVYPGYLISEPMINYGAG